MRKRGIFGFPPFLVIGLAIILLVFLILGFLSGSIGTSLFGHVLPEWLSVEKPKPELPAEEVFAVFHVPITNSVIGAWFTIIVLTVLAWLATRNMKLVPGRFQAAFEFFIGLVMGLCERIAGEKNARRFFPIVATIFFFVLFNAWLSLIPGFGSILIKNPEGLEVPLIRGANTDINMPLTLAIVSFIFVESYAFKILGIGYLTKFFNFAPLFKTIGNVFQGHFNFTDIISGFVNVFVGFLELLSELIRLISLTFRLFGNMTAGEILLIIVAFLMPYVVSDIFYVLELLIGLVQALIFSSLTLVYVSMATAGHGGSGHHVEEAILKV